MDEPKDDLLDGAQAYADFTGWELRRVFYALEKGLIPGGKMGNRWIGSKRRVREHLNLIASGKHADGVEAA